jgi:hypothetical protein
MLWFFERDQESLELETWYDNSTGEFVATVRTPGSTRAVRFKDAWRYQTWLRVFEADLKAEHWRAGSPVLRPDGWPNQLP